MNYGDYWSTKKIAMLPQEMVFDNVNVAPSSWAPFSKIFHLHNCYNPSLVLRWTPSSTSLLLYMVFYDSALAAVPNSLTSVSIHAAINTTAAGYLGDVIPLSNMTNYTNALFPAVQLRAFNNDAINQLTGLIGSVIMGER